ncbi:MAG TPA: hypothetical protein VFS27_01095, partial [Blastocatellia bacterium]|nr:hypothetical protein [Blastocatellia bacterium]
HQVPGQTHRKRGPYDSPSQNGFGTFGGSVAKNILATFCSGGEQVIATIFCMISEFLRQSLFSR